MNYLDKFRPLIQSAMPTAFDESLSNYELITKVIGYLNLVIDQSNQTVDFIDSVDKVHMSEITQLKNDFITVQLWLENEALPANIAEKLDIWYDNGKLATILNTEVLDMKASKQELTDTITTLYSDFDTLQSEFVAGANELIQGRIPNSFKKCKFIGNRGLSHVFPENSIESFKGSGSTRGSHWGALANVRYTADGNWICMHDESVNRTTTGSGNVASLTVAQIKSGSIKKVTNLFGGSDYSVPTLGEFLETVAWNNVIPVIEVKSTGDYHVLLNIIKDYGFLDKCIIASYDQTTINEIRALNDKIKMAYYADTVNELSIAYCESVGNCSLHIGDGNLSKDNIEMAHQAGLEIGFWVLDSNSLIDNAVKWGADYILTNRGAGHFFSPYKQITLNRNPNFNSFDVAENYSSERPVLEWDSGMNATKVTYEVPFKNFPSSVGSAVFINSTAGTKELGYTFGTLQEYSGFCYLKTYKNGTPVNPMTGLTDDIQVTLLISSY